ncbi:ThuA domain-containing protein [Stenotrophomonas sp. NPDC077464]|uniref:ThuA domain-containing protein n=1 Tax=unclassified Stenotrophomonas TaxID=196198 RepID=UPI0037D5BFC4
MRPNVLPVLLAMFLSATPVVSAMANDRVLVFTHTAKFRHDSIPTAVSTLRLLAERERLTVDQSENPADFNDTNLARYRVVVFANTTGDVLDPTQQQAMEAFIRAGGGFMGVHSAADTEYEWPWYGQLVGAYFKNHPEGLQFSRVQPERDGKAQGNAWPVRDELYNYRSTPRGRLQIVATVDERMYQGGTMGADHPIAWCHAYEGGRSWYTGLGHDAALYRNRDFQAQLRQGLLYAAGRSPACG